MNIVIYTKSGCPNCVTAKRLLDSKGITKPTPIQLQGLPVLLQGRDMIGIATTGSGKTMVFSLPLVMMALQEEVSMPLEGGEGPVGLVLCPSRELARQTHDIIAEFADVLRKKGGYPEIRSLLAIGGMDMKEEMETVVNALIETSTSRATRRVRSLAMVVKYGLSFISLAKAAIVCELFNNT